MTGTLAGAWRPVHDAAAMFSPEQIHALTRELVACPSVSPDPISESRCARLLVSRFPDGVTHGLWALADDRPVVWALLQGRSRRTVVLLGHYDTVGTSEYGSLGDPQGDQIAFDPEALRDCVLSSARRLRQPLESQLAVDLDQEAEQPGTWMFGRGALDMKSGLAAGIAVFDQLAADPDREGSLLFMVTPDEEHESAGMRHAASELSRMRETRGLDLIGVVNLDYGLEPAAYLGVMGKLELGCFVIGRAAHVGAPDGGPDALELAAAIVTRVTRSRDLADQWQSRSGPLPKALHLDDFKSRYSIETVREAWLEFNLIHFGRPLHRTLDLARREVNAAIAETYAAMASGGRPAQAGSEAQVLMLTELSDKAGAQATEEAWKAAGQDARAATLTFLNSLVRAADVRGPLAVLHLLPPYYPAAAPGRGPLTTAARSVLGREQIAIHDFYPFISDASYVAWHDGPAEALAPHFPALGRAYQLPIDDARALDLEVVNLGPWGRDAHGVFERVHAPYAFDRLPRLIEAVIRQAWSSA